MKSKTWRKHHKWLGITFCFFMLMFCLSGIVLNHRMAVREMNVSRGWLPDRYRYKSWNGGLLRGTMPFADGDSVPSVLVYGSSGIWRADSGSGAFRDFNKGLPRGADFRQIRGVTRTRDNGLFAASIHGLYRYDAGNGEWRSVPLPKDDEELLTDITCRGDTLIVAGRSFLYLSATPFTSFTKVALKAPEGYRNEVTLFRTVWMLHSGELFGLPGRLIVDGVAVVIILLCLTGLTFWMLPKYIRHQIRRGHGPGKATAVTRISLRWHDRLGRYTIVLTLFIAVTGWCLRPPVMIPLAMNKTRAIPATALDSDNPWEDRLRMIRYDDEVGDWLLSTSEGLYSLPDLAATPVRTVRQPPVSVMGLNVMEKDSAGRWLCGSFSGLFVWDRAKGDITDYYTGEAAADVAGPPFGKKAISGYSADLGAVPFAVDYYDGTGAVIQPEELETLPMPLWNVALEIHSGRIYMGIAATYVFIFIAGILAVWCLWSGWKIRAKRAGKRRRGQPSMRV